MKIGRLLAAGTFAALALAAPAAAETYTVTGLTDGVGDCSGTACTTIRAALRFAGESPSTDTIVVPAGVTQLSEGRLDVDSAVVITGAGIGATEIRADLQFADRVFTVNAVANATIARMTVGGGGGPDFEDGGNVLNDGALLLDHVRLTGGEATLGGGIANRGGSLTIRQSLIDGNTASEGSAIANAPVTTTPGLGFAAGQVTISDTTIAGNASGYRGAVYTANGNATALERVTLTRNTAGDGEAAIVNEPSVPGTVSLQGSIVSANGGFGDCRGPVTSAGGNVYDGTAQDAADCGLAGEIVGPVGLPANPSGGVYEPPAGSPALDRFACAGADQRDLARPQGGACDAGAAEVDVEPETVLDGFAFSSPEPGVSFECAIAGRTGFAPCASPYVPTGLGPGTYTLLVRAVDAGGRPDPTPAAHTFTIPAQPTPTPTPEPTPEFRETVVVEPVRGIVLVCPPPGRRCTQLRGGDDIPFGSIIDTKKGEVELTSLPSKDGKPQSAKFKDGIFRVTQSGSVTVLTLTEALAPCPRGKKAAAAQKRKPKSRKLWGDGKGKFRTKGQYSSATIRGTRWLVQDGCRYTRTKVSQGSVLVRDDVRKRNIVLRKGKTYTARPK